MHLSEARRLTGASLLAALVLGAAPVAGGDDQVAPIVAAGQLASAPVASTDDLSIRAATVPAGQARVRGVKGTPPLPRSALAHLEIPVAALLAYHRAATVMEQVDESCGLSWTLLAAIGRVESDHGRSAGAQLMPDGTSSQEIRGVPLDGAGRVARIRDTDAGLLDGDQVWDRAVGPMQFLPSTWSVVAVDADGDGVRSPDDLDDAALAAAVFLCSATEDLDTTPGRRAAVLRYNPSDAYVTSVLALERAYSANEFDIPGSIAPTGLVGTLWALPAVPDPPGSQPGVARDEDPDGGHAAAAAPTPGGHHPPDNPGAAPAAPGPAPAPDSAPGSDPGPTDAPGPEGPQEPSGPADTPDSPDSPDTPDSPEPEPPGTPEEPATPEPDPESPGTPEPTEPAVTPEPGPVGLTGVLASCGSGLWCLDQQPLDLGDGVFLSGPAGADLDADGAVESGADELGGLAGTEVTVLVAPGTSPAFVLVLAGLPYAGR